MYASCGPAAPFILDALTDMQTKPTHKILTITPEVKEKKKKKKEERKRKRKRKRKGKKKERKDHLIWAEQISKFEHVNE